MASIFTFDPDPPRVSSPWSTPQRSSTPLEIQRLEAEPQEGPIEYKLHLLLRTRREYRATSTGFKVSGSYRSVSASPKSRPVPETSLERLPPLQARTNPTRQQRLEQLTTQLLWRLQQSCPIHSTSTSHTIKPVFPDAGHIHSDISVRPVVPGLEDSRGALYELGVADDGTFVGLVEDEMTESIMNLRAMAASLGCLVDILRMVQVGDCEWYDGAKLRDLRKAKLWVAEAYVKPNLTSGSSSTIIAFDSLGLRDSALLANSKGHQDAHAPQQLKVSFTGATMSGKSTLLGSLTTGALDNGRGKSRLNLLKHRHEIVSGMTSSVTQELLGYEKECLGTAQIVNYASGNVSSWTDIHASCEAGRLVLLSDSAGHPRYRRTTVRGLVGWAPDWTLLCIPADNADNAEDTSGMIGSTPSAEEVLGVASVGLDLSQAHLELCLKLNLRLVIVVTKLDLASKAGLKSSLTKVLSTIKASGRTPKILANPSNLGEDDLMTLPASAYQPCSAIASTLHNGLVVPIVLTSAVQGTGVSTLHALLCNLPIPNQLNPQHENEPATLFHIEDTYNTRDINEQQGAIPVLSGFLKRGHLSIGDELLLGPFTTELPFEQRNDRLGPADRPPMPTSRSFPGALSNAKGLPNPVGTKVEEWHKVRVTSLRNLRLPAHAIYGGQVGTIGLELSDSTSSTTTIGRVRKGMVLASGKPKARGSFVAEFARSDVDSLSIGMGAMVYVASVRASAKVVAGAIPDDQLENSVETLLPLESDGDFAFNFEDEESISKNSHSNTKVPRLHVTFQFTGAKEYLDTGALILVMPGGGPGLYGGHERGEKGVAGLEGFVGVIVGG